MDNSKCSMNTPYPSKRKVWKTPQELPSQMTNKKSLLVTLIGYTLQTTKNNQLPLLTDNQKNTTGKKLVDYQKTLKLSTSQDQVKKPKSKVMKLKCTTFMMLKSRKKDSISPWEPKFSITKKKLLNVTQTGYDFSIYEFFV